MAQRSTLHSTGVLRRFALAETVRLLNPGSIADDRGRTEHPMRCVALDCTGLWTTHASRCFETRRGGTLRKQRSWMKWVAALWMEPQIKWGEALSARCERTRVIQALLHGLVYNLCRLATLSPSADRYPKHGSLRMIRSRG